ncbi:alpha/beta hydrolase [Actinoplanes sp. Pm04-4]|uniref:Alpha/beta hydrolase n=1 Tax=Paractinoplanes pyxinae TaxID=2997416 RepID=A0ABT4BBL9_9ACTN|nr:alpha/beta hydrolase [Actinoplanes pyxinae]MCY1143397.1 alpha/beta hydrolase [Actinoplanes pyxinae]
MADAVVIPGAKFGPGAPLPMYAGDVAGQRGAMVHRHMWTEDPPAPGPGREAWVQGQVAPVLDGLPGQPLLIGKSLGCFSAGLAADRSLPAVWLTPVLTAPWLTAALERATAPFLLVGGSADPVWDRAAARRLSPYVVEVPAANHGMYVPGPLTDTIAVLARIVVAVEEFLDDIGWP